MGETAFQTIKGQIEKAEDTVIDAATNELSDNLSSFPVIGLGLSFVKHSAEQVLLRKVEKELAPQLEEHTTVQLDYIKATAEKDGDKIHDAYEEALLESNPLWLTLDAPQNVESEVRERIFRHSKSSASTFASWIDKGGGKEFEDFVELAHFLGKSGDEMAEILHEMLYYIDLMEEQREYIDLSRYTIILTQPSVKEWFLDNFISGLEKGRAQVKAEISSSIEGEEPP